MNPPNPSNVVNLSGDVTMRGATLALPLARVREFLPAGLELGPQNMTAPGTHPVMVFFNDMFRAQVSIPNLCPNLTYHEHSIAVPHLYLSRGPVTPRSPGPYYFSPRLYLDNLTATLSGVLMWGLAKELGSFNVTSDRYTVAGLTGQRLTSLAWKAVGGDVYQPASERPFFAPIQTMLSQPIVSLVPAALGPFFALCDFEWNWGLAMVRAIQTAVEVDAEYVRGHRVGRYPASGWSPGIDVSVLGSFEMRAPWRLSLPYPPPVSPLPAAWGTAW